MNERVQMNLKYSLSASSMAVEAAASSISYRDYEEEPVISSAPMNNGIKWFVEMRVSIVKWLVCSKIMMFYITYSFLFFATLI